MGFGNLLMGVPPCPEEEVGIVNYNEKEMKAFALHCEHLTDVQLAHIQYCDNASSAWC